MIEGELLTPEEKEVLELLALAWNKFQRLEVLNPIHRHEFMHGIHAAQRIVMARPAIRDMNPRPWLSGEGMSDAGL